ncbi:MAG: hypothetical protein GF393_02745 [Armatimonadia bacterium]|nr:hypothetical protein [Armatimonadia bacterium]
MRIAVVLTLVALLIVGVTFEAAAQRQPMAGPSVNLDPGIPSQRGIVGQNVPWSGPPRVNFGQPRSGVGPYFQPSPDPFQSSYSRRWQNRLNEIYGGIPADRNIAPPSQRGGTFGTPSPIFVQPQPFPIIECFGTRCQRVFPPIR